MFGAQREDLYRRAKIVLLLKPNDRASIDHARVLHLLHVGELVVAEEALENDFGTGIVTASRKELPRTIQRYLSNPKLRRKQRERSDRWLAENRLGDLLRPWIELQESLESAFKPDTFPIETEILSSRVDELSHHTYPSPIV